MDFSQIILAIVEVLLIVTLIGPCTYKFIKVVRLYITDGADLRTCFLSQFYLYFILFLSELIHYLVTGRHNQFCIFVCRLYPVLAVFFYTSSKFIGKKTLFSSSLLKNILYIIVTLGFFSTTIMCVESLSITEGLLSCVEIFTFESLKQLTEIVMRDCFKFQYGIIPSMFVKYYMPIYIFNCSLFCVLIDHLEKRSVQTKIGTLCFFITSLISFSFTVIDCSKTPFALNLTLVLLMYTLPWVSFMCEANNILYYANLKINDYDLVAKTIRKCSKEKQLTEKSKAQAMTIAKMIVKDPRLNEALPLFTKSRSTFIDCINDYIDEFSNQK